MGIKDINFLIEASDILDSQQIKAELEAIKSRYLSGDTPIMLPLVGEFSSGKTTLINSLTDSHALETAPKPTTETIYEIHFGAPSCSGEILFENGETETVDDIKLLVNERLKDAKVVTVYDTSKLVSPYTILVDTPGISSSDPKHIQTLVDFLPQADAILLVIDIQQQLTKSLTDFIKAVRLSNHEIYAVLTKADTKSHQEIEKAKRYLAENSEVPVKNLAAVSAQSRSIEELQAIFKDIENRKKEIIENSLKQKLQVIANKLLDIADLLLNSSDKPTALDDEIRAQKQSLTAIQRRIEQFINSIKDNLEDVNRDYTRKFEDRVSTGLNSIINVKSGNYDSEAIAMINSTASVLMSNYRQQVINLIADEVSKPGRNDKLSLESLTRVDLSGINIQGLNYNINLNELGHEHDKWIKGGIIAVAAVAATAAVVSTGGGAATIGSGAMAVDTVADIADTVSDVGSIVSNRNLTHRLESAVKFGQNTAERYVAIKEVNAQGVNNSGVGKGMLDSLAGFIAEKTMSKPQRARAVRQYIDNTLAPEFKTQISQSADQIIEIVKDGLNEAAKNTIEQRTDALQQLLEQQKNNKDKFEHKMLQIRELQTKLLTL